MVFWNTRSNYGEVRVDHIRVDWTFDSAAKCLAGVAIYRVVPRSARAELLPDFRLDTKKLTITNVDTSSGADVGLRQYNNASFTRSKWFIECGGENDLSDLLIVPLEKGPQLVKVHYTTTKKTVRCSGAALGPSSLCILPVGASGRARSVRARTPLQ